MTTTGTTAAGTPADGGPGAAAPPCRAGGVELIGELTGSGYRTPPALVRRADGQTVQLTRLLYLLLEAIDGERDDAELATAVSRRYGRSLAPDDVRVLVESKLRPLGLLRGVDGSEPEVRKSNPLLALRFKYVVSNPATTRRLTTPFALLFHPVAVVALVAAFVATSAWVLFEKGLASATYDAFDRPALILLVFAITVVSAGFHEFGHAAACRYGGATPGVMGAGLYLVWPAFYTEVSDSYRLGRGGRVRVDLGGLYFNAIVSVAMFGIWAATEWDALLLVIATQLLQMLRQLAPLVRFDGYHILADITGVPDLYAHIRPTLLGLLPSRWGQSKVSRAQSQALKPWARAVVSVWVLVVVPLLLLSLVMMVVVLPRVAATAWLSLVKQWDTLQEAFAAGDFFGVGAAVLSMLAVALPVLAIVYLLSRLVRRTTTKVMTATEGRPVRRGVAAVVAAALVAAVAWAWWPDGATYRPIQPTERGTLVDGLALTGMIPGEAPVQHSTALRVGQVGAATRTVWATDRELPTKDSPQLALILLPKQSGDVDAASDDGAGGEGAEPAWVFPFNKPAAPGEGDNQAMAVNTDDGSTVYDVAFALVWATDGTVGNKNEAYALASCTACATVAVGFQVVLIVGQADITIPQNIAAAVNYSCLKCVTYALATQLVVTLPGVLGADAMAELDALWRQIEEFGANIGDVPLSQLRAKLTSFEKEILDILENATSTAGSTATAGPSVAPSGSGEPPSGQGAPSGNHTSTETGRPGSTAPTAGAGSSSAASPSSSTPPRSPPSASSTPPTPTSTATPTPTATSAG